MIPPLDPEVQLNLVHEMLGQRDIVIEKLTRERARLYEQIEEMASVIEKLREENGELVKSRAGDGLRCVPGGVQGEGRGLLHPVSECTDQCSSGLDQVGPGQ